jgi:hypothetical protein
VKKDISRKELHEKKKGGFLANLFGGVLRNEKQKKNFALPNRRQRRAERTRGEIMSERKYKTELAPVIGKIKR